MHPHRVSGIGQPSGSEGIGGQQKAEVVSNKGLWNGGERKDQEAEEAGGDADHKNRQNSPACQLSKQVL
jgi:hypothetical protein